jgi:hypothetical protein
MIARRFLALLCTLIFGALGACSDSNNNGNGNENQCQGAEKATERLFLQQLSDTSVVIKWRGEAAAACVGTDQESLGVYAEATATEGDHMEVVFTELDPQTTYFYSIGAASTAPADQFFTTSPEVGQLPADGNTRVWLIGDSGTGGDDQSNRHAGEALEVLAGMQAFIDGDGEPVDIFMMLGDNAYDVGSDFNYQQAVFEVYPGLLKNVSVWSTIGNHEMGMGPANPTTELAGFSQSSDPDSYYPIPGAATSRVPYLDIFTLPADGEVGGVPSGTEQYYSFDFGNMHFVSLDSQLSARDDDQRAAMQAWLVDDLSSNNADWTIVIFHHPPYSKGASHDSDTAGDPGTGLDLIDTPQKDMREEFVPLFDDYGVDVVYSGHSHSYERSYYLNNLTGTSDTYSAANNAELVDGDSDRPASGRGGEAYAQLSPTSGGVDDRVVYTVAGNGGKADSGSGGTAPDQWLLHPAHVSQPADTASPKRNGMNVIGSVLVDANETRLIARFINADGEVLDSFTINR